MNTVGRIISLVVVVAVVIGAGVMLARVGGDGSASEKAEVRKTVDSQPVATEEASAADSANGTDAMVGIESGNATGNGLTEGEQLPTAGNASTVAVSDIETSGDNAPSNESSQDNGSAASSGDQPASESSSPVPEPEPLAGTVTGFSVFEDGKGFVLSVHGVPSNVTPKWFRLGSPDRFVVDLPGRWNLKGRNVLRFDSGVVDHAVAGYHPDKLRFVVHFREGAVIPDGKPEFSYDPAGLVIRVP